MRYPLLKATILINVLLFSPLHAQQAQNRPQTAGRTPPPKPTPPPVPNPPNRPNPPQPGTNTPQNPPSTDSDAQLQAVITQQNIIAIDNQNLNLPDINTPKAQLGKQLFFAKNLGGEQSVACVSCHHPALGGGDNLSLPIGVKAVDRENNVSHDLLGLGRFNGNSIDNNIDSSQQTLPSVGRNAPTVFNIALLNRSLFWDSRVERTPNGQIVTPDSELDQNGRRRPDANLAPDTTLAAAQARFPVTVPNEMRGDFLTSTENQALRASLAERFNNQDNTWLAAFNQVFSDVAVSFDHIADAIGEYERSMLFANSPWNNYLKGDLNTLTDQQKAGAVLFFTPRQQGGANCVACHNGPTFSDQRAHLVAFPQFGNGAGNESNTPTSQDFGRENVSADAADRYHFRTPSLLNVAETAPYGHSGVFQTLEEVVGHYVNPRRSIDRLFAARGNVPFANGLAPICRLPQLVSLQEKNNSLCENIFTDAYQNSIDVVNHLDNARAGQVAARAPLIANIRLSPQQVGQIADFLRALTDPCVTDRDCLAPWIIDGDDVASFPDNLPLVAHDKEGNEL